MDDRIFNIALQLEQELRGHVAELLKLQIVKIGWSAQTLPNPGLDTMARRLGGFANINLPLLYNVNVLV